jgi:hypothetical protein
MSSPISARRTPIPSSIDPRRPRESWIGPSVPRSPSALVIIWTCDPRDIHALGGDSGAKPALRGWSCLTVPVPARVNQDFAETGHPQLCVILPDAKSGRETGELRVEQLPTQLIARQATLPCSRRTSSTCSCRVFHAGHPPREDSRPLVMLGLRPGARALLARPFNGLSTACTSQRRCARPDWTAAFRRRARPRLRCRSSRWDCRQALCRRLRCLCR